MSPNRIGLDILICGREYVDDGPYRDLWYHDSPRLFITTTLPRTRMLEWNALRPFESCLSWREIKNASTRKSKAATTTTTAALVKDTSRLESPLSTERNRLQ
jgi:hypothetical protein